MQGSMEKILTPQYAVEELVQGSTTVSQCGFEENSSLIVWFIVSIPAPNREDLLN